MGRKTATSRHTQHTSYLAKHPRGFLAAYSIIWLFVLAGGYYFYPTAAEHSAVVGHTSRTLLLGMASAMLGAVAINFYGISKHRFEKDSRFYKWSMWYLTRPFMGAIVGVITFALLSIISTNEPSTVMVTAASFVFGMQERRFLQLLEKVGNAILGTKSSVKTK